MVIKENSNIITLRLINNHLKEREEYLEKMWEETYEDEKQLTDHCIIIGRLRECYEMRAFMKNIFEVNEDQEDAE